MIDPTGLSLGLQGLDTAYGIYQTIKGNKLAKNNIRPTYQVPDEIKSKLTNAQMMALEGLPAEQKQEYINDLQRSANFGLSALNDRQAGLAGLGSLVQNQNDAYSNLLSQDAAARQANQRYAGEVQSEMAGYKDRAFDYNKVQPYQEKAAAARSLMGAGIQNIQGGLGGLTDTLGQSQDIAGLAMQAYNKAVAGGFKGTFEDFKKQYGY